MKPQARIEKLRDKKGVYGYGIFGVSKHNQHTVILRPDRIVPSAPSAESYFQQLPPLPIARSWFKKSAEWDMAQSLANSFLESSGCIRPRDDEWPGLSDKDRADQRRHYWSAMARSRRILNKIIREVMAETADPEIVRLARRFTKVTRYDIYRHISREPWAAQLAITFPLLARLLYACLPMDGSEEARAMVLRGAELRDVARVVGLPMYARRIEPGASHFAVKNLTRKEMDHLPNGTRAQTAWFSLMSIAGQQRRDVSPQEPSARIRKWTAKNAIHLGNNWRTAKAAFLNLNDWMEACENNCSPELIRRPFSPDMSIATVRELSDEWHYAVAMADHHSDAVFPEPWLPEQTVKGYSFVPLRTPQELFIEGRKMHNCLATYVERIAGLDTFIYSVRKDDESVAVLSLNHRINGGEIPLGSLREIAGPCNAPVGKDVTRAAIRFANQPLAIPKRQYEPLPWEADSSTDDLDSEIPF